MGIVGAVGSLRRPRHGDQGQTRGKVRGLETGFSVWGANEPELFLDNRTPKVSNAKRILYLLGGVVLIMGNDELIELGQNLQDYCEKYDIPLECFFDILNDQKVNPMIRGKGWEHEIFTILRDKILDPNEWIVQKLNLNPQPNMPDVDIGVTHKRTAEIIKLESKPAVRGSISSGKGCRIIKVPHFKVKCHRSRSNKKLTTNDAYSVDVFDIVITKPINGIFKGATIDANLQIIKDAKIIKILYDHYSVDNDEDLKAAINKDWRFVVSQEIGVDGFIPRTPYVQLANDPNWQALEQIEDKMLDIIKGRIKSRKHRKTQKPQTKKQKKTDAKLF